jgi:uncharacterized membrane protein YphA (DoxX/SURF4 family)
MNIPFQRLVLAARRWDLLQRGRAPASPKRAMSAFPELGYVGAVRWFSLAWMQRLFSMFPGGLPGCGLVVLRLAVMGSLWLDATGHFVVPSAPVLRVALGGLSILLSLGLLTSLTTVLGAIPNLTVLASSVANGLETPLLHLAVSVVLVLLGPGAYSIDARLFGRRIVVEYPARSDEV